MRWTGCSPSMVMAGLVPAIHDFLQASAKRRASSKRSPDERSDIRVSLSAMTPHVAS